MRFLYLLVTVTLTLTTDQIFANDCKEGRNPITGHKIIYGTMKISGGREYWVMSRSDEGMQFTYHNKDILDKNFVMPQNSAVRFVTERGIIEHRTTLDHRALPHEGFSFWVPMDREELKDLMFLSQIEIDLPGKKKEVKIKRGKLMRLREMLNCLY